MTIKDVLVHVTEDPAAVRRIRCAAALASRLGARLSGIGPPPVATIPALPRAVADIGLEDALERLTAQRHEAVRTSFDEETRTCGVQTRWIAQDGGTDAEASDPSLYTDLLVVGMAGTRQPTGSGLTRGQLIAAAAVPVLIVPDAPALDSAGRHIVIGWNGRAEAGRAVRSALPLLRRADSVEILLVTTGPATATDSPLRSYLALHGVTASVKCLRVEETYGVSGSLLARAEATGRDLIVMGAYGQSRLRQTMVGSTTDSVIARATIPVLVHP